MTVWEKVSPIAKPPIPDKLTDTLMEAVYGRQAATWNSATSGKVTSVGGVSGLYTDAQTYTQEEWDAIKKSNALWREVEATSGVVTNAETINIKPGEITITDV